MQTWSNDIKRHHLVLRGAAALATTAALVPWLWQVAARAGRAASAGLPLRPDEALAALVAGAALAVLAWLALGVLLELLSLLPGALGRGARRLADVVTPPLLRRAAAALLGVGIVAGLAPGASVAATPTVVRGHAPLPDPGFGALPDPGWGPPADPPVQTGDGWVPAAPTVRSQPDVRVLSPGPRTHHDEPAEVVVRRGDSLWAIAARHLGADPSDAEIARAWPAWFEANREVIGDDPDLLRPGQVLRPPEGVPS
jgi:nucleoid-associated protein YgaU